MEKIRLSENTVIFDEGGVRFFLIVGSTRALLIDSGMQTHNALELAREYTDLPISLINTHADMDHTGSNAEFAEFYMHPAECANYFHTPGRSGKIIPVYDGSEIDLGGRVMKIIEIPGHTPGSIAILDTLTKRLFSGDPVQDGRIFMFGPYREMHAYVVSMERLIALEDSFGEIYPSHGSRTVPKSVMPKLRDAAIDIISGKLEGAETEMFGGKVKLYRTEAAEFLCDM